MKVLYGSGYTRARLAGILHEAYVERNGGNLVPRGNDTVYAEGVITTNAKTNAIGLIVNVEDKDYAVLPEPHLNRLVDVVGGDGWMDTVETES